MTTDGGPSRTVAATLVVGQFALLAALVVAPSGPTWVPPGWVRAVGALLVAVAVAWGIAGAVALGRSLRAMPLPAAGAPLRTTGIYGLSRHPIYSAILVGTTGIALRSGSSAQLLILAALAIVLNVKARFEERALARVHPEYTAYAQTTKRFLPTLRRA